MSSAVKERSSQDLQCPLAIQIRRVSYQSPLWVRYYNPIPYKHGDLSPPITLRYHLQPNRGHGNCPSHTHSLQGPVLTCSASIIPWPYCKVSATCGFAGPRWRLSISILF